MRLAAATLLLLLPLSAAAQQPETPAQWRARMNAACDQRPPDLVARCRQDIAAQGKEYDRQYSAWQARQQAAQRAQFQQEDLRRQQETYKRMDGGYKKLEDQAAKR